MKNFMDGGTFPTGNLRLINRYKAIENFSKLLLVFLILLLSFSERSLSQNICVNYESINSIIDNDTLETSFYKQLVLKIYYEQARIGKIHGIIEDDIDFIQLMNEDSVQFNVVYSFIVKVNENGKNVTIDFDKDSTRPIERIILIYNNIAIGHVKFTAHNQYVIFLGKEFDTYDFYQCLSKQNMIYLRNFNQYCNLESGYLKDSFNKCLNRYEKVPVINYILKNYKDCYPYYMSDEMDLGPGDFH